MNGFRNKVPPQSDYHPIVETDLNIHEKLYSYDVFLNLMRELIVQRLSESIYYVTA